MYYVKMLDQMDCGISLHDVKIELISEDRAAASAVGENHITDTPPSLASEDFAVYGTEIPSFFYWVGSGRCCPGSGLGDSR